MANETNIDQVINKVTEDLIKKYETKYREAGKAAMKEIRSSIVEEWFGEYSFHSMNGATQYLSHKIKNKGTVTIEIESYIDLDIYDPKPRAEKWVNKYGGMTTPKEYVLNQQLYRGEIALPDASNAYPEHGWVNKHYAEQNNGRLPLWDVLITDSRWSDFESYFWKYVK